MGLGTALLERIEHADGQITNANLSDYNLPALGDLPRRLTHELIERDGAEAHGLGETALPPVPAAIGNALGSLGLHLTELPMTAERVVEAVDARERAADEANAADRVAMSLEPEDPVREARARGEAEPIGDSPHPEAAA
jgi:hypothetical protein